MMTQLSPVGNPQGRLLVLGAGWAGYQLVKNIDKQNYDVRLLIIQKKLMLVHRYH